MDVVSVIASTIVELLVAPIGRRITYVFNYDGSISYLKKKVEKLKMTKERTQHDVDRAERQGEEIESDVRKWLSNVNDITGEIDKILEDEEQVKKRCFMGLCPNLKSRYQLSRKARKKLQVIVDLQGEGKFDRVSYPAASQGRGVITLKDYEAFESRTLVLNQILEALKDADVNIIGLYGMPGVGKTTLLKKVAEQVRKYLIFDVVVLAVVSHAPVLVNIQGEIADGLGFKLEAETVSGRANLLRERLKKEEKILVILDDIWARLDLEDVGIPSGSDHEGCKLLMTSRDLNVLSRDMGVKVKFKLQVLPRNEAWNFFEKMVGHGVKDPSLESVAPKVAERCQGLPILLATVARALKNGNLSEWKDALERLKNKEEMDAKVHSALELSYRFLKGDEIKFVFLLCGQSIIPHSICLTGLLKYIMGLGLFKSSNTLEAARHRLYKYVNDLKASCLLLEGKTDGEVKMHDLVHKFAALIASRDHHVFSVAYGTALDEWPKEDVLEKCTAIFLPYCKVPELPAALKCPKTESFTLYAEDTSLKIQDDFFREMKKLKVIDLSALHLSAIPLSLQFLENLQTLCLDGCDDLGDIAMIGKLKRLLFLSLVGSNIVRLAREIGQLTRLQFLDLSYNPTLEVIPPNVLSCLTRLEDLYMGNSFLRWEDEGSEKHGRNASLAELKHLQNLLTLDIHITDAKLLPKDLLFDKLERFRIYIGDGWNWLGHHETSKTLKLKPNTSILFKAGIRPLLKRTEVLHLRDLKGVKNILHELDAQGFHPLKHLHIEESLEIQYIVDSIMLGRSIAFPLLELLSLANLCSLEKICNGRPRKESFSSLRILKIETCHRLKNLFSLSLARDILGLEEIGITNCKIMEVVVAEESEGDAEHKDEMLKWSQLRRLTLQRLPQLTGICSKVNGPSTSETKLNDARTNIEIVSENELETPMPVFNKKIVFPNLEDLKLSTLQVEKMWSDRSIDLSFCFQKLTNLTVEGCGKLKYLFTSSMVKSLAHLRRLEIHDCNLMEEIIVTEGAITSEVVFPKLDFLKLSSLRNLIRFCTSNLIECPFLKELHIENCHALDTFISNSVTANTKSTLFDENVLFLNLEELRIIGMNNLKMIWHNKLHSDSFCKLKALAVGHGKKLLKVFPPNMLRRFQNLHHLSITDCDELEEVFDHTHSTTTTQLRTMYVRNLLNLKNVWNGSPQKILSFQYLRSVIVRECPRLQNLFPASVALDLLQLEVLHIDSCGVLEEIVAKEEGWEEGLTFVFPKITSFTLWWLPELRRFYPGRHTLELSTLKKLDVCHCDKMAVFDLEIQSLQGLPCREKQLENQVHQPLFSFIEIIPSLLELSLNNKEATIISQGQFPVDILHKLKVLELQCFHEESAVFSFDLLIQRPHDLEKLVVRDGLFKELFSSGLVGEEKHARTLAWTKCLKLIWLPNLERIWNQDLLVDQLIQNLEGLEVWRCHSLTNLAPSTASFQNLRSLDVWGCQGLIYLIASSTARSLVQLTVMTVKKCNVLTEIVANEEDESENEIIFRKLESLRLDCLASLTSFCSANVTFKFPSLTEVIVKQCPKMETFSQGALSTPKLQRVWLTREKDKQRWKGDLNTTIQQLFTEVVGFHGLKHLKVSEFPKLKEVWHGEVLGEILCDLKSLVLEDCASFLSAISSNLLLSLNNLEELDVRNCESLEEVFNLEGLNSDQGHVGLLPKLEKFYLIDLLKLRNVWNDSLQRILGFKGIKLLKVHNCIRLRNIFTPSIAAILVQLQELEVKWCPMIEEIIARRSEEEAKTDKIIFPQLNSIIIESLPNLTSFYCGRGVVECPSLKSVCIVDCSSTFSSAFLREQEPTENGAAESKIVFSNLESMELSSIKLEKIWHDQSCVQKLTSLTVEGCGNLRYLFTSSMVESLAQLQKLKIYDCKRMEEIIVTEHLGEGDNVSEIVFPELSSLEIKGLPKLIRFCICNLIKCPSLEVLQIGKCPDLKEFVSYSLSAEVGTAISESKRTNSTLFDDKVAFPNLERLVLNYMDGLVVVWHHELHSDSFCKLKKLEVEQGKKLSNIFPPKMLRRFKNLEYLHLTDCASLEEVFDLQSLINEKEAHDVTATQLREMYLWKLPSLTHVWNGNPQGILSFQNLHKVDAWKCPGLRSLFPSSIAVDLLQLEKIEISECGIEEIVSKEEGVEAVTRFEFPRVTSLILFDLPELRRFYPEMHTLEWPVLKELRVCHCEKMSVFDSEIQNLQGRFKDEIEIQVPQPLFSLEKITPSLEEISVNSKDTKMIWEGQFPADFSRKLKVLSLHCFHDKSEDFPFGILHRFQNMEKLVVRVSHFKQLFPEGLAFEEEHARALTRIRHLRLFRLPDLEHIWNQHFQVDLLLPNLETLEVLRCSSLIYLAPATVSFQNLRVLYVYQCKALIYLVTSSTAKHLVQLTEMTVEKCDMVREVVSIGQEEAENEIIIFKKLEYLTLDSLASLTSFCSANFTFKFPSLAEVTVIQCPRMKIFSPGFLSTPKLEKVWLTRVKDKRRWKGNLSSTIQQLYTEVNSQDSEEE